MDTNEKAKLNRLLSRAHQDDRITQELQSFVHRLKPIRERPSWYDRLQTRTGKAYERFWYQRRASQVVAAVIVIASLIFLGLIVGNIVHSFDGIFDLLHHADSYSTRLLIGELASSAAALVFAIIGAVKLPSSRLQAYEYFRRALLTNLFLTQFFTFARIQFAALPGFLLNLLLLIILRATLTQERRHLGR